MAQHAAADAVALVDKIANLGATALNGHIDYRHTSSTDDRERCLDKSTTAPFHSAHR